MSGPPDVSVCIVNWNGQKVLRNCLQSLQTGQDDVRVETIVVDNASTDGSADIIPADFPNVVLIRNGSNRGFSAANNQAAAKATGRYFFFLNNDTVVPPGALGRLVRFLDEHPEVVAVGPKLIGSDGLPQRTGRNLPTLRAMLHRNALPVRWTHLFAGQYRNYRHTFDANVSGAVPQLAAAALLVRPEAFCRMGGWDETFEFGVEDVDFCLRLAPFGSVHYLADVSITHLGRVSSHLNRGWVLRSYQCGYVQYFRKHHQSRLAPFLYKTAITVDTPIRLLPLLIKAPLERLAGKREGATRTRERAAALWFFLGHGMMRFWKS
ncbi:MAG TPA: glycosyltransferase family 2 protein [Tepidisphaeraceae bacterium]|nr:glycosyltransferase family 2 protein [Tepidisphaeraceae bacterium]